MNSLLHNGLKDRRKIIVFILAEIKLKHVIKFLLILFWKLRKILWLIRRNKVD